MATGVNATSTECSANTSFRNNLLRQPACIASTFKGKVRPFGFITIHHSPEACYFSGLWHDVSSHHWAQCQPWYFSLCTPTAVSFLWECLEYLTSFTTHGKYLLKGNCWVTYPQALVMTRITVCTSFQYLKITLHVLPKVVPRFIIPACQGGSVSRWVREHIKRKEKKKTLKGCIKFCNWL